MSAWRRCCWLLDRHLTGRNTAPGTRKGCRRDRAPHLQRGVGVLAKQLPAGTKQGEPAAHPRRFQLRLFKAEAATCGGGAGEDDGRAGEAPRLSGATGEFPYSIAMPAGRHEPRNLPTARFQRHGGCFPGLEAMRSCLSTSAPPFESAFNGMPSRRARPCPRAPLRFARTRHRSRQLLR